MPLASLLRRLLAPVISLVLSIGHAAADYPDLQWTPHPLDIPIEPDARYIDYEGGDDGNPGTRDLPWKHHPWDPDARGKARSDDHTATFYFKNGVTYRGHLIATRSGSEARPIVLGSTADWGNGPARISGAHAIESGWRRCSERDSRDLPRSSLENTWCTDTTLEGVPQALWVQYGDTTHEIVPARQPNWAVSTPDDPRSGWAELSDSRMHIRIHTGRLAGFSIGDRLQIGSDQSGKPCPCTVIAIGSDYLDIEAPELRIHDLKPNAVISNGRKTATVKRVWGTHEIVRQLTDPALAATGPHDGATVWVEHSYMPKPMAGIVTATDPANGSIEANLRLAPNFGPKPFNRYYLEGLSRYLDAPGEFAVASLGRNKIRLMLWMPDDADPNQWRVEVPQASVLVDIKDRRHIRIAGLEFTFARQVAAGSNAAQFAPLHATGVLIRGNSSDIRIDHNRFQYLPAGVVASPDPARKQAQTLDRLTIEDNEFVDIEGSPIALTNGWSHAGLQNTGSRMIHVAVNRNRIENCGYRTLAHWSVGAHGHGIEMIGGELVEISGNHVRQCWGSGIVTLMGSDYSRGNIERPLIRGLVHHNKVVDSVLGLQDYGGIASFMGGPLYMYNNISGNAVGYRYAEERRIPNLDPFRGSSFASAFYFDGQYKGYFFNNVGWGKNNDIHSSIYNAVGFKEALGLMNAVFNNSFYRVAVGLHKDMPQHGRNHYLGNIFADIGHNHIQHEPRQNTIEYQTLAYGHNTFHGDVDAFGQLGAGNRNVFASLSDWTANLRKFGALQADSGIVVNESPLPNAETHDYRASPHLSARNAGIRYFVPWGLARVVGEWHFYASPSKPQRVTDESIHMNSEWVHRSMFAQIPRRDLHCPNTTQSDYVTGELENWIAGALRFDGKSRHCFSSHAETARPYEWRGATGTGTISTSQRETLDIEAGNLVFEAVIRPSLTGHNAGLAGKLGDNGYSIHIAPDGRLRASLDLGNSSAERMSATPLTDAAWHHVLVEFDRKQREGITIYLDGRLDNGAWTGEMNDNPLRNEADFTIGRVGTDYYSGQVDFVRVAKSTLRESETNIGELYNWQFDGPATRDLAGHKIGAKQRGLNAIPSSGNQPLN